MKRLIIIFLSLILPLSYIYAQVDTISRDTIIKYDLRETVISAIDEKNSQLKGFSLERIELNLDAMSQLPKFLGATDPMRIIQLLPGVQTTAEGSSGLYIRGGEPGHNQVLWNDTRIYNPSHLLGLFSVFNNNHIESFSLQKSSSSIAVVSPSSIAPNFSGRGSVGLCLSDLSLSIPFSKKTSLYLSGRVSYVDLLIAPLVNSVLKIESNNFDFNYIFGDANGTLVTQISKKDKLILNFYYGLDKLNLFENGYNLNFAIKWSNMAGSAQWFHTFDNNVEMKHSVTYSQYSNYLDAIMTGFSMNMPSSIEDVGYKNSFDFYAWLFRLSAGVEYSHHKIIPQQIKETKIESINSRFTIYHANEASVYLHGSIPIARQLSADFGLKYTYYFLSGGQKHSDHGFEPSAHLYYYLGKNSKLSANYHLNWLFINMATFSTIGLPIEFWIPSTEKMPPQKIHNFSLGYNISFDRNQYEFLIEGYYKRMYGQTVLSKSIIDISTYNYSLEEAFLHGDGYAYGTEMMFKKNKGNFTGWISYTLGWSTRSFQEIDNGAIIPARYDRRHDLSVSAKYEFNKRWDVSAIFVYASGNPYTKITGFYFTDGTFIQEYGPYNGARLPDYHRLDLSVNFWIKRTSKFENCLNLSIFNVYKHTNPIYYVLDLDEGEKKGEYTMSMDPRGLYDIIPSISWSFKF